MPFLHWNPLFLSIFFIFFQLSKANFSIFSHYVKEESKIAQTITVDQRGNGDFISVQKAIDSVPSNNNHWILIYVKAGTYNEKVEVTKQFIMLQGESRRTTWVQWGDYGSATGSATFILSGNNFIAMDISFKNTYNLDTSDNFAGESIKWAPAATIYSDKASFYRCGFWGVQDTLTDANGRHYFESCYIQGAIDFIWGGGQSVYQKCLINATTGILDGAPGYITAQARGNPNDQSGFLFISCYIEGTGPVYLGRAYGKYSRVVFKKTFMSNIVKPEGWSSWSFVGQEYNIAYSEMFCFGPGASRSRRVKWVKKLSMEELKTLTRVNNFINRDGWIQGQPKL